MLSTRLLRPQTRQLLSRNSKLSTGPRTSPPARRAFHATAPRKDGVLDAVLFLPHEMMSLIHSQLPWYATIPLSAFIVRGLLVTTVGSWARALVARYVGTHPLRQALAHQKRHEITRKGNFSTPKEAKLAISKEVKLATRSLNERWKCTLRGQLGWTVVQIPLFVTMAEIIRKMCGAQDGLLAMGLVGLGLKEPAMQIHGVDMGPVNPWFESSLASEGMLWFPDLLVADPTGVLPFVVSGLMFSNVYFTRNGRAAPDQKSTGTKVIRRVLLGVALLIGPMCQHLPAALMLYWASSTTSVILWNWWLDWRYPSPRDFVACKRPLITLPSPTAPVQNVARHRAAKSRV